MIFVVVEMVVVDGVVVDVEKVVDGRLATVVDVDEVLVLVDVGGVGRLADRSGVVVVDSIAHAANDRQLVVNVIFPLQKHLQ